MKKVADQTIQNFVEAGRRIGSYSLVKCSSGNLSCRVDAEHVLLSATNSWLADITADQVAVCSLEDGTCTNGKTPTVESEFHLGILRDRGEINVVLHFQTPYATAIACGRPQNYNFNILAEIPVYIGTPAIVDYSKPGSEELAIATIAAAKKSNMVILRNHGLVTVGADYNQAIQRACFFELVCQIILCQNDLEFLSSADLKALAQ